MSLNEFSCKFRVYYEDTDCGGIVYHANYLKFCERARTDFVREVVGYNQQQLEDMLTVTCVPVLLRRSYLEMYQEIKNDAGQVLFAMRSTIAHINFASNRPEVIPADFSDKVKEGLAPEDYKTLC